MTMTLNSNDSNIELCRLGDSKAPLVITMNSYQGMRLLDIRRYYYDKKEKLVKPGIKGISFKEEEFPSVFQFLEENYEKIINLFTLDMTSSEVTVRHSRKEEIAGKELKSHIGKVEIAYSSWPGPNFFHIEESGSNIKLLLNKRSKTVLNSIKQVYSAEEVLFHVISSFIVAKKSLDFDKKISVEAMFDYLEFSWGQILNK